MQTECPRCGYISIHDIEIKEPTTVKEINQQIDILEHLRSSILKMQIQIPEKFLKKKFKLYLYKRYQNYVQIVGVTKRLNDNTYDGIIINDDKQGWKARVNVSSEGYTLYRMSSDIDSVMNDLCSTDSYIPRVNE
jgi:hypothetical protein